MNITKTKYGALGATIISALLMSGCGGGGGDSGGEGGPDRDMSKAASECAEIIDVEYLGNGLYRHTINNACWHDINFRETSSGTRAFIGELSSAQITLNTDRFTFAACEAPYTPVAASAGQFYCEL